MIDKIRIFYVFDQISINIILIGHLSILPSVKCENNMISTRLPDDAWSLLSEFGGSPFIPVIPLINKEMKTTLKNNANWERRCKLHFPNEPYPVIHQGEEIEINWMEKFKQLEDKHYPSNRRIRYLFRTIKDGILSAAQEIKPTLDDLNRKDKTEHTVVTWANKLEHPHIANYFYQKARQELAPNKTDVRKLDFIDYLVTCDQGEKLQKLIDVNDSLFLDRWFLLFRRSIVHGSKSIIPILLQLFPDLAHLSINPNPPALNLDDLDGFFFAIGTAYPLRLAAYFGHIAIARLLLDTGVNVNGTSDGPLFVAALNGHLEMVKLLLSHGANVNQEQHNSLALPFQCAALNGHLEILLLLLPFVTDIDHRINEGGTALFCAAQNGHLEIVRLLLLRGANALLSMHDGTSPLFAAARDGHLEVVRLLLAHGVNPKEVTGRDASPLLIATERGHLEIVRELLLAGADVNQDDEQGLTPLVSAAQNGHFEIVKLLIAYGAKVNHTLDNGISALHQAAKNGHLTIVEFLLEKGADANRRTKEGRRPHDLAKSNAHTQIARMLLRRHRELPDLAQQTVLAAKNVLKSFKAKTPEGSKMFKYVEQPTVRRKQLPDLARQTVLASHGTLKFFKAKTPEGIIMFQYKDAADIDPVTCQSCVML